MSGNTFVCDVGTLLWRNGRLGTAVKNANENNNSNVAHLTTSLTFVRCAANSLTTLSDAMQRDIVARHAKRQPESGDNAVNVPVPPLNRGYMAQMGARS